jgi:hypothetical protein
VHLKDLLAPDDTRDALRKFGGLLFGIGMLMVALRKDGDYSDFVLFLIYAVPAVPWPRAKTSKIERVV